MCPLAQRGPLRLYAAAAVVRCGLLSTLLLTLVLAVLPAYPALVSAYPSPCSQHSPAVAQY